MKLLEAIQYRHSVRQYKTEEIDAKTVEKLQNLIADCNAESGLNIQLILNEEKAFNSKMAHYGSFRNVRNYIALIGDKTLNLAETCGYYGEKIVLHAQKWGLNTCWVALTYNKKIQAYDVADNEKVYCIIAIGYGENQGTPHKSKPLEKLYKANCEIPDWFKNGVLAAQLAPTAINQQKFQLILNDDNTVTAKTLLGFNTDLDLGIIKYHFEIGAGIENFTWKKSN